MHARLARVLSLVGGLAASAVLAPAQIVEFRAVISASQEVPTNASTATGVAVMLYDVRANTFDLFVTLNGFAAPLTASHIHEAAAGVNGPVVTNLGAEAAYGRSGSTVGGAFRGGTHGGDKLKLLQNGAYLNFHTAAFPGGEIRGQLIAQPKRLTAIMNAANEVAANPVVSSATGGAILSYNPGTNRVTLEVSIYNFTNTLTASHFHEAPAGVNGPVVTNLGGAAAYTVSAGNISRIFTDLAYTGDPVRLLTGGAYLNFHSNVYGPGEIRGQVIASDEVASSRLVNASARGFVGTGSQVLIAGVGVTGPEPVGVRLVGRGPSLAGFGVQGALADPVIAIYGPAGLMATNDNHAVATGAAAPVGLDAKDAVLDVILPPGGYTVVMSGAGGATGVGLIESFEQRSGASRVVALTGIVPSTAGQTAVAAFPDALRKGPPQVLEICGVDTPVILTAKR
jgi:hypothetical protein